MAAAALDADRCSLCRRHFLQGEAIRVYRESGARGLARVCPLCTSQAERRGWELCEATRDVPLQIHADPARVERARHRDRLVERLEEQLGTLREAHDALQQQNERERLDLAAENARLREQLAQAGLGERRLERAERRLRELDAELAEALSDLDRVRRARVREAQPAYLRRLAADAFNRSPHADDVRAAARRSGPPRCGVAVEGAGLPRRVRIRFAWEREAWEYAVDLDLVERTVGVHALGRPDARALQANAAWTPANGLIADP